MRFTKMNGAGNDFIIVENLRGELDEQKLSSLRERSATGVCPSEQTA